MNRSVGEISCLLYSPGLVPANYFMFPKVTPTFKWRLIWHQWQWKECHHWIKCTSFGHTFGDNFMWPLGRCKKCAAVMGGHSEEK